MEGPRGTRDPPPRPLARHLSDADRLRKVIQELMDTEKSYVKVTGDSARSCLLGLPVETNCVSAGVPRPHLPRTPAHGGAALGIAAQEGDRADELRGLGEEFDSPLMLLPRQLSLWKQMFWFVICSPWEGSLCCGKRGLGVTLGDEAPGSSLLTSSRRCGPQTCLVEVAT